MAVIVDLIHKISIIIMENAVLAMFTVRNLAPGMVFLVIMYVTNLLVL